MWRGCHLKPDRVTPNLEDPRISRRRGRNQAATGPEPGRVDVAAPVTVIVTVIAPNRFGKGNGLGFGATPSLFEPVET